MRHRDPSRTLEQGEEGSSVISRHAPSVRWAGGRLLAGAVLVGALAASGWTAFAATPTGADPATTASAVSPAASPAPLAAPGPAAAPAVPTAAERALCPATSVACVDLAAHTAWLQDGAAIVVGPVPMLPGTETGLRPPGPTSSATPTGTFHVQRKVVDDVSSEFDEPMPHAVYFAPGGIAFHEGSLTKTSNGCVHLSATDATTFYDRLHIGDDVTVF